MGKKKKKDRLTQKRVKGDKVAKTVVNPEKRFKEILNKLPEEKRGEIIDFIKKSREKGKKKEEERYPPAEGLDLFGIEGGLEEEAEERNKEAWQTMQKANREAEGKGAEAWRVAQEINKKAKEGGTKQAWKDTQEHNKRIKEGGGTKEAYKTTQEVNLRAVNEEIERLNDRVKEIKEKGHSVGPKIKRQLEETKERKEEILKRLREL